ncbi:DsrE family protein [Chryseobacterium taeanense]|uniref:DsrE family protein n=1 Tax=Chryseobacterium taeanense TaxID=311334 RepID=UPI0035B3D9FA
MRNTLKIMALSMLLISLKGFAQKTSAVYKPAKSVDREYKALYVINESDDAKIRAVVRNINNALEDPRLKGKLKVELLAFGGGVEMFRKSNPYYELLMGLKDKGVTMVQCENTLREKKIDKSELFDFVNYTPSGNGEIILRQYEG